MTTFQQALLHLITAAVAVAAIVALAIAGDLTTTAAYIVLGVTGFGSVGIAGVTPAPTSTATPAAKPPTTS